MSGKTWDKIDKYLLVLTFVLVLMAIMVIVVFRGVFSSYLNAYEINPKDTQTSLEIDKNSLEEAYAWAMNKTSLPLQIRE